MRYLPLGASGIQASVVGFGAWAIGGWPWGGTDKEKSIQAIQASLDAGISLIDTAPAYGLGLSEEYVGEAIAGRARDKIVIATKCGMVWHTTQGRYFLSQDGKAIHRYLGPESIRYECEKSLQRLRTDYIDLYQTHWQDITTPIEETIAALLDLKREGKIRAIGVSNVSLEDLKRYTSAGQLDSDQERYSMIDRRHEKDLLPFCQKHNMAFLPYSPLENGLLTGKVSPERVFPPGDMRRDDPRFSPQNRKRVALMLDRIRPIADAHGITIAQLVVAWTLAQPGVTHVLVGARDRMQAAENARAGDVVLKPEEVKKIEETVRAEFPA